MGCEQHQVEIDPNSAIYKAEKVDVKTGEEDEETLFTLGKAKLFEYQKSEGDGAVSLSPAPGVPLSSSHFGSPVAFLSPTLYCQPLLRTATCLRLPLLLVSRVLDASWADVQPRILPFVGNAERRELECERRRGFASQQAQRRRGSAGGCAGSGGERRGGAESRRRSGGHEENREHGADFEFASVRGDGLQERVRVCPFFCL